MAAGNGVVSSGCPLRTTGVGSDAAFDAGFSGVIVVCVGQEGVLCHGNVLFVLAGSRRGVIHGGGLSVDLVVALESLGPG